MHPSRRCSHPAHHGHRGPPWELTPKAPPPPSCQPPPGPRTSLAPSALRLDCLHANPPTTSVDQSAEACPHHPSFVLALSEICCFSTDDWSSGCIVKRTRYSSPLS